LNYTRYIIVKIWDKYFNILVMRANNPPILEIDAVKLTKDFFKTCNSKVTAIRNPKLPFDH